MSAIFSHAVLSSSRPPRTDCSASTECGGSLISSTWVSGTLCVANCAICPGVWLDKQIRRQTETAADHYSQRDEACKRKNKKGCFHSPFFSSPVFDDQPTASPKTETVMVAVTSA